MNNLCIVVPFFNGHETIQRLLDSLPANLPVIVVDDKSDVAYLPDRPNVRVVAPFVKGYFTGAVNRGIEACDPNNVLILNQDVYFTGNEWLTLLEELSKECGLIGERISGLHPAWRQGYIHGTFMYIDRYIIDTIGLLNEVDYPLWGSTCEYQLRAARAGLKVKSLHHIPDFVHTRKGQFGEGIQTILQREPNKRNLFINVPPEISVVTVCHNYGRFLPDLVSSLIGGPSSLGKMSPQTFQSFELIIVDYGSTDDTPEIAKGLASDLKAIRYIRTNDNGSSAALNVGIKAAYGKYIAVVDADDMMESFRLDMLYRLQLKNPHSFIYDDLVLFANGKRGFYGAVRSNEWDTVYPTGFKDTDGNQVDFDFEQLLNRNGIAKGIMFPKVAWQETGGYPELMKDGREDWAFNVALGLKGWCGVKAKEPGYLYRRGNHNRTLKNTSPEWKQKFFGQMLQLYPEVYRGVRPMGCCGNKLKLNGGSNESVSRMSVSAATLPGKDGFEILEYIGTNVGDMTWYGPESRARYIFGGNRRVGYVDKRDVAKMVALMDQGKKAFRVYQKPVVAPLPDTIEEPAISLPFDPSELSVAQLRNKIEDTPLSGDEVEALISAEEAGLNRKGAMVVLEAALEAVPSNG